MEEAENTKPVFNKAKWLIAVSAIAIIIGILIFVTIENQLFVKIIVDSIDWIKGNPVEGFSALSITYIFGVAIMLPASLWTFTIAFTAYICFGALAGFFLALGLVYISSTLGSFLAFAISRFLLKDQINAMIKPTWHKTRAINKALLTNGFKVVFLWRITPIAPFNVTNYIMGASQVIFKQYAMASIGQIPVSCVYIYIGMTIGSITDAAQGNFEQDEFYVIFMSLGGVIAIAAAAYIVYISKRELNKIIKANLEPSSEDINEVVSQPESNEDEVRDNRLHESSELEPNQ